MEWMEVVPMAVFVGSWCAGVAWGAFLGYRYAKGIEASYERYIKELKGIYEGPGRRKKKTIREMGCVNGISRNTEEVDTLTGKRAALEE